MIIAADARFLGEKNQPIAGVFGAFFLHYLMQLRPNDRFLLLTDKPLPQHYVPPANAQVIVLTPHTKNYVLHKWWFNVKLPKALKKHGAELLIGTYGLCSAAGKVPQWLLVHDMAFRHKTEPHFPNSKLFYKRAFADGLTKADRILAPSEVIRQEILAVNEQCAAKVHVCGSGPLHVYSPMKWEEREAVKEERASGCEYFVCCCDHLATFVQVLKAFSVFKKWQRSNMKLLWQANETLAQQANDKLATYKYRHDVQVTHSLNDQQWIGVLSAAYAVLHIRTYEGFSYDLLHSMVAGVPVVALRTAIAQEVAGESALFFDDTTAELPDKMKQLYKDETMRSRLIEAGLQKAADYHWPVALAQVQDWLPSPQ